MPSGASPPTALMLTLMPTKADLSASFVPLYFILSLTLQVSGTLAVTNIVGGVEKRPRARARGEGKTAHWPGSTAKQVPSISHPRKRPSPTS